jgi:hypothetical protein
MQNIRVSEYLFLHLYMSTFRIKNRGSGALDKEKELNIDYSDIFVKYLKCYLFYLLSLLVNWKFLKPIVLKHADTFETGSFKTILAEMLWL